jgi:hypothetical protein
MSFDLMVFEKSKAPKASEDFFLWYDEETQWQEERDYNSLNGTSPQLVAWFMEMKKTFPPMNGEYSLSDEEAFANDDIERHLTDYSIGSNIIYSAFAWSLADEAYKLALNLAKSHDVGFYNPQTGEICCNSMILCKIRIETSNDDMIADWKRIEKEILTLDSPKRQGSFVTLWFEQNGTDQEFMQCMPTYPEQKGFLKKLFSSSTENNTITSYAVEAGTGDKIYTIQANSKEKVLQIFHDYYSSRTLPDISDWTDSGII